MTKLTNLAAVVAITASMAAPTLADEKEKKVKTNDPFVSTQSTGFFGLGTVGIITVTTVLVGTIVAISGSSTSTTSTN